MSSVDVIVPCYRYGHFLRDCVESVLAQAGPSVRVLIIDDASPDNTAEVASDLTKREKLKRDTQSRRRVINRQPQGPDGGKPYLKSGPENCYSF